VPKPSCVNYLKNFPDGRSWSPGRRVQIGLSIDLRDIHILHAIINGPPLSVAASNVKEEWYTHKRSHRVKWLSWPAGLSRLSIHYGLDKHHPDYTIGVSEGVML